MLLLTPIEGEPCIVTARSLLSPPPTCAAFQIRPRQRLKSERVRHAKGQDNHRV